MAGKLRKLKQRLVKLFDDLYSYIHFVGGILYGFSFILIYYVNFYVAIAFALYILFIYYEAIESSDLNEFLGDITEFNIGVPIGFIPVLILYLMGML